MNLEARTAIEALRAGVPNRAAVRLMGTDEAGIEQEFDALLASAWKEPRPGLGIAGGFGSGKSHFLGYLAEVARTHHFVVSRVVISKETPLADPGRVFEAAIRGATLPNRNDDPVTAALASVRESAERADALEQAVRDPQSGFAPIFAAIVYLVRRPSTSPEAIRRCERFITGGRVTSIAFRQALSAAGAARLFDLRMPPAAELAEQRIRFASLIFQTAGFAGWCLLLDEVELIGRYTPLQRASAYAWLGTWLALPGGSHFRGIVAVYAITDDFVSAVIDHRGDEERLPERLMLKGRAGEADSARAAIQHIGVTVQQHRLRPPGDAELLSAGQHLRDIYQSAYGWPAPNLPAGERTATRTMRQYIKSWITQWDLQRLTGSEVAIVEETMTTNYEEDAGLTAPAESPVEPADDESG